jgi:hypothetical protein
MFLPVTVRFKVAESTCSTILISKLTLRKLRLTDTAHYKCHVLNTDDSATLNLTVTGKFDMNLTSLNRSPILKRQLLP